MSLKITNVTFQPYLPGANELKHAIKYNIKRNIIQILSLQKTWYHDMQTLLA